MLIRHQELRMKNRSMYRSHSMNWLSVSAMAWACAPTLAQGDAAADAAATYQRERAACLSIQLAEDRATCLREAGAAQAQRREGGTTLREKVTVVPAPM
jgi:hypothetical protein